MPWHPVFECGNVIGTNLEGAVPYTNGVFQESTAFGPQGKYFTAKHEGLFVMAAIHCEIDSFHLSGRTATDGAGTADGLELSVNVAGQPYRLYVKRIYDDDSASINQIVIVPGDGTGISHSFPTDTTLAEQTLDGLAGVDRIYYALVSRYGLPAGGGVANIGLPLRPTDAQEIARELIQSIPAPFSADGNGNGIPDECD